MIFDDRTLYLLHVVKAADEEFYTGFDASDAWKALVEAANTQKIVEHLVIRMNSQEARSIYYGRKQRTVKRKEAPIQGEYRAATLIGIANESTTRSLPS